MRAVAMDLLLALSVASLIFLLYSAIPTERALINNNQVYVSPEKPLKYDIVDFGGKIQVTTKNAKAVKIKLDGKEIKSGEWISIGYIGRHNLTIESEKDTSFVLSVKSCGPNIPLCFYFSAITVVTGAMWYLIPKLQSKAMGAGRKDK